MKTHSRLPWRLFAFMVAIGLLMAGCDGLTDTDASGNTTVTVTGVTLNKTSLSLEVGDVENLTATVAPGNATNKDVSWTSSNNSVATVANGKVTAVAVGTTTITVKTTDGSKTAPCSVTVQAASSGTPPATPEPFNNITATQLVAGIKIGWNLGNALDAEYGTFPVSASTSINTLETAWGNPATTKANINAIKNAGFNAIRIPVSWYKAAGNAPDYTIRTDWMTRVTEVINYAVSNDMYIILNTHHDESLFKFIDAEMTEKNSLAIYQKFWEQIAAHFKNYNEKLIFEGLNEPRTKGSANEWSGGTAAEHTNLNKYYPIFLKAVRESGGNNDKRILMINTYAASATATAVNALILPTDTVANKLVVSIHSYSPYPFCYIPDGQANQTTWSSTNSSDTSPILSAFQPAYDKFISKGIPVIIGEFGAQHKNNTAAIAAWAKYYVTEAKKQGFACFVWDNGVTVSTYAGAELFGLFNRTNSTFVYPEIITALMTETETPPSGGGDTPIPPTTITGNLGNYAFSVQEDNVTPNYQVALWNLSSANVTAAQTAGTKLVLQLTNAPTATMALVWQGPASSLWWESVDILNGGTPTSSSVNWDAGAKTFTVTLNADTIKNYGTTFKSQTSLNLLIGYWNGGSVNDLGITSANLVTE